MTHEESEFLKTVEKIQETIDAHVKPVEPAYPTYEMLTWGAEMLFRHFNSYGCYVGELSNEALREIARSVFDVMTAAAEPAEQPLAMVPEWVSVWDKLPEYEEVVFIHVKNLCAHGLTTAWWWEGQEGSDPCWVVLDDALQVPFDDVDYWAKNTIKIPPSAQVDEMIAAAPAPPAVKESLPVDYKAQRDELELVRQYLQTNDLRLVMFGDMWSFWADSPANGGYSELILRGKTLDELIQAIAKAEGLK